MSFRLTENRHRSAAQPMKPLVDPAAWRPEEMAAHDDWIYELSNAEIAELTQAVERASSGGGDIKDVKLADFPLPTLGPALADIRGDLLEGRGFVLIRGVPVAEYSRAQSALAFWGIGLHLGRPISQNGQGHLLGHVKDIGNDYNDPTTRGYTSRAGSRATRTITTRCARRAPHRQIAPSLSTPGIHAPLIARSPHTLTDKYRHTRRTLPLTH
ncbi:MAG: hypothetical protein HOA58_13480, partial [Rhodospirillaceae bacterium]|nr:hypothetical protein [Rhodospirillaceae bacterium]